MHVSAWVVYAVAVVLSFVMWYTYDKVFNTEKAVCFWLRYVTILFPVGGLIVLVRLAVDLLCYLEEVLGKWYSRNTGKKVEL